MAFILTVIYLLNYTKMLLPFVAGRSFCSNKISNQHLYMLEFCSTQQSQIWTLLKSFQIPMKKNVIMSFKLHVMLFLQISASECIFCYLKNMWYLLRWWRWVCLFHSQRREGMPMTSVAHQFYKHRHPSVHFLSNNYRYCAESSSLNYIF